MWLWIMATLIAFFIKGLCGFANTLVFTSILGFGENNINISPVEILLGFPTHIIMICKNRRSLKPRVYLPLVVLVVLGSIPGALLLKNVDALIIKLIFGAMVVIIGIQMLMEQNSKKAHKKNNFVLGIIGILSGLMCGLFGVGAMLAGYVGKATDTTDEFKVNLNVVFFAENVFRITLYIVLGVLTLDVLKQALLLMPCVLIGLFTGMKCSSLLDENKVKKIIVVMLIITGLVLIIKTI